MSEFNQSLLLVLLYRSLTMAVGLAFCYMGYRLFLVGTLTPTDLQAVWGDRKLLLKRAAPGTLFAVFGAVLIGVSLVKGVDVQSDVTAGVRGQPSDARPDSAEPLASVAAPTTDATLKQLLDSAKLTTAERNALFEVTHPGDKLSFESWAVVQDLAADTRLSDDERAAIAIVVRRQRAIASEPPKLDEAKGKS